MHISAVLLDMDGTIWENPVDWRQVRRELGLELDGRPIYSQLAELSPSQRAAGEAVLRRHEARGVAEGWLRPGTDELLAFLRRLGIRCALVTNNSRRSVAGVLQRHHLKFDLIHTRDHGAMKPAPEALLAPLAQLGVPPAQACVVGDSHLDLWAAQRAGVAAAILVAPRPWMQPLFPTQFQAHLAQDLSQVREILAQLISS
ncbi:MAG: HAD family hydrolase [Candidatus Bipolaricaulaceae bacterium]